VDYGPNKRERILDAAADLIVRDGLQSSMSAIADAAGVATGSLYTYFKSKEDMIAALYEQLADQIADAIVEDIDRSSPHRDRLMRYVDRYIDFIWVDARRAFLFEYLSSLPSVPPERLRRIFTRVSDYGDALLHEAQEAGALRPLDPNLMGAMIGGTIRNCLKWRRHGPPDLSPAERRSISDMCWNAIAAASPADGGSSI
jgi:TetR/AcrR family transcriptional regulator, multidrug resistance operon repressor